MDAHIYLNDLYADATGIYSLTDESRPLQHIAMHDVEENGINSVLFDAMKVYRDNQVMKHFGLSWNEVKLLTHEEFTYVMELSAMATKEESKTANNTINSLTGIGKNK